LHMAISPLAAIALCHVCRQLEERVFPARETAMNRKPRILLIPNVAWWIIGEMGKQIIARFGDKYDFYFLPETVTALADIARQLGREAGAMDGYFEAAAFRDRSGIGRNLAIEVLEYLDRIGVTRFAGGKRRVVG